MASLVCKTFYFFFGALELVLLLYVLSSWFPGALKWKQFLLRILEPMLAPIRYCLSRSVFQSRVADMTPLVAIVVLSYLQSLFYSMA